MNRWVKVLLLGYALDAVMFVPAIWVECRLQAPAIICIFTGLVIGVAGGMFADHLVRRDP